MNIQYQFCTWQEHKSLLLSVRQAVFVIEQNIPEELEIDEHDPKCLHIIALDNNKPVGTARLLDDGHIGRMCVLKSHRLKGIALELINRLIQAAKERHINPILLNAQQSAIPFYEKAGFSVCSDTFLDAGIEHKTMQLKYPQAVLGDNTLTIQLDNKTLCRETIASLISQASQRIAIFSQNLEYELYHQTEICNAIKSLVRKNRHAQVRIICKDSQLAAQRGHCFINLAQNFSSFIEIRKPSNNEFKQFHQSWLLIDDVAYCHIKNIERYQGSASFNQKLTVKESLDFFNHAWENSTTDQQTRRLSL